MRDAESGILGIAGRLFVLVVLYVFGILQYVAVFLSVWQVSQTRHVVIDLITLPGIYPIPFVIGFSFTKYIRRVADRGELSTRLRYIFHDWIIMMVLFTYVSIFCFRSQQF